MAKTQTPEHAAGIDTSDDNGLLSSAAGRCMPGLLHARLWVQIHYNGAAAANKSYTTMGRGGGEGGGGGLPVIHAIYTH